jgi:dUTP pyrophosphatase
MLNIKRTAATASMPNRAKPGDAGYDLAAAISEVVMPGQTVKINTGVALELPPDTFAFVTGRSSLNARGILCHMGTIDNGYRGEVQVVLTNLGHSPLWVDQGDRIAQLVVLPLLGLATVDVGDGLLSETVRGHHGFGSTGA